MKLGKAAGGAHLTYCTNIHRGETWADTRAALENYLPQVKRQISPATAMGVGLRLSNVASETLALEADALARFKAFLADKRRQEKIRDSLLAQITVIKSVDGDRYIWPHLLDEITKALPAYTWLTDLGVSAPAASSGAAQNKPAGAKADSVPAGPPPALTFQINGRTIDIQAYTRFLRQLEASPWIMDVTPVSAMTVVEKERPVTAFTIRASYNRADSAYIRTAPFSQSVR